MPVSTPQGFMVPTQEEFDALEQRVTSLEGRVSSLEGSAILPPDQGGNPPEGGSPPDQGGSPPDPGPSTGVQAKRIAALVEGVGVNTFSSLDPNSNVWGSWPADYSPDSVIAALRWITGDSGFKLAIREYHYNGRESIQQPWLDQIHRALPGTEVIMCVGANGSTNDVSSMLAINGVGYFEGLNEGNTNFGSGEVDPQVQLDIQQRLWQLAPDHGVVWGPSIVGGMPNPGGWVEGYAGATLGGLNAAMSWGNGHYYPPHSPDLTGDGCSVSEYTASLAGVYGHPVDLTEFHPTLYNSAGHGPTEPGWSGERDAYYTLLTVLRCGKLGVRLWWYALYDYGEVYRCGLFPKRHADEPRPAAQALRNLCTSCPDPGQDNRTFSPGKLGVSVHNLPEYADWDLYQASDRRCFVFLWRAAAEPGGQSAEVTVRFDPPVAEAVETDLLSGREVQTHRMAESVTVGLDAGVRVLAVSR